ncbi:MbcA/ParS/Xre antitoxin family protein [Pseudomonas sp. S31]|uniref:MbcA/ParS/Xre antitoxin family protein n=1 Tax=Pseudomonas sp. S31 TaxID=1564473 RepID=UPI0019145207|nr:MbcA/ParS/Xre antitoxin family protein [Pseudomonas sp. S31]
MDYVNHILAEAESVFGDKRKAAVWLSKPCPAFGGRTALELARDQPGHQKVMEELKRLGHGYGC